MRLLGTFKTKWLVDMADNSGGNGGLYFIVGALVVVVALVIVVVSGHFPFSGNRHVDVHVDAPHAIDKAPVH